MILRRERLGHKEHYVSMVDRCGIQISYSVWSNFEPMALGIDIFGVRTLNFIFSMNLDQNNMEKMIPPVTDHSLNLILPSKSEPQTHLNPLKIPNFELLNPTLHQPSIEVRLQILSFLAYINTYDRCMSVIPRQHTVANFWTKIFSNYYLVGTEKQKRVLSLFSSFYVFDSLNFQITFSIFFFGNRPPL